MEQLQFKDKMPAPAERAQDETSPVGNRGVASAIVAPSLIDPRMEHDSCGVGFVASALGKPSHDILAKALTALGRLEHRGAVAPDGRTSDGVGILTGIPKKLCWPRPALILIRTMSLVWA